MRAVRVPLPALAPLALALAGPGLTACEPAASTPPAGEQPVVQTAKYCG